VISVGEELRDEVRRRYAGVALSVREGERSGCCGEGGIPESLRKVPLASAFIRARKPLAG
jgi:hypothetical protein